jgi:hypothetical protein
MKPLILTLLLSLLASGSVIGEYFSSLPIRHYFELAIDLFLEPRQFLGKGSLSKLKALKVEDLPSKLAVSGAKRVRITYGPYKIKGTKVSLKFVPMPSMKMYIIRIRSPGWNPSRRDYRAVVNFVQSAKRLGNSISMDAGGTSYSNDIDSDFPRDITILKAATEVQNKDGKRMELKDGIYNHHTAFFDITKANPSPFACASRRVGFNLGTVPVFAAGAQEYSAQIFMATSGDVKSGYYLRNRGVVMNLIDLVNYNEQDEEVYTSTEIDYVPGKPTGYRDSYMTLVDPGLCGGPRGASIHPPKGVARFSINSTDIVMSKSGYFVYTLGHMHDGGVNAILKVNDVEMCNSRALYGGEGHTTTLGSKTWETIRETTPCTSTIRVQKGDRIYMQANYDVELHPSYVPIHSALLQFNLRQSCNGRRSWHGSRRNAWHENEMDRE